MVLKVAVLASGRGSDFQAIIDGIEAKKVNAKIAILITDNPEAEALDRAEKHGIKHATILPANYSSRLEHDKAVKKALDESGAELIVLAGYMRIIKDKDFLKAYEGRIINIHPSLLPSFPGAHAQKDAFEYGSKVSGYTIHFVDSSLDSGPIIHQETVYIGDCRDADEVAKRILAKEHEGLPKIVDSFSKGKYAIYGRKVKYESGSR